MFMVNRMVYFRYIKCVLLDIKQYVKWETQGASIGILQVQQPSIQPIYADTQHMGTPQNITKSFASFANACPQSFIRWN